MMIREHHVGKVRRSDLYPDTLCHFNPNHDPRNGQFTSNKNGTNAKRELRKTRSFERAMETGRAALDNYARSANALSYLDSENKKDRITGKRAAAVLFETAEIQRSRMEKRLSKLEKQGVKIKIPDKVELDRYSKQLSKIIQERSFGAKILAYMKPGLTKDGTLKYKVDDEAFEKYRSFVSTAIKDLPLHIVEVGGAQLSNLVNNSNVMNMDAFNAANMAATQAAIQASNQAMSLAMTGGMNPFMFG